MNNASYSLFRLILLSLATLTPLTSIVAETLAFERPQLAGISGFRAFWDKPIVLAEDGLVVETDRGSFGRGPNAVWALAKRDGGTKPGAIVFDAIHRSVLVRFPGSISGAYLPLFHECRSFL